MLLEKSDNCVDNSHHLLYVKIYEMAEVVDTEPIQPRCCGRQRHRFNADDMETHYKMNVTISVFDQLLMGIEERFDTQHLLATNQCLVICSDHNTRGNNSIPGNSPTFGRSLGLFRITEISVP